MSQRQRLFGEWLLALKCVSEKQLQSALDTQQTLRKNPVEAETAPYIGEILITQGHLSPEVRDGVLELQKLLSPSTRLSDWQVDPEILKKIPARMAQSHDVFPLMYIQNCLVVACAQDQDEKVIYDLKEKTQSEVYLISWRARDIQEAVVQAYKPRSEAPGMMHWIQDEYAPERGPFLTFVGTGEAVCTGSRYQSCLHVRSEDAEFLMDCGPTSLMALKQMGLNLKYLQGILLTHGHGDHFGGVPFILLEHLLQKRTQPFWIMGPAEVLEKAQQLCELFYPGMLEKLPFSIQWLDIKDQPRSVPFTGIMVFPFAMKHQSDSLCLGYQVHLPEEKIIAYSGDTAWNSNLELLARGTDVMVCECSFLEPVEGVAHLSYKELLTHLPLLKTRQLILTHMGEDMLRAQDLEIERAYDGLTIDLSV